MFHGSLPSTAQQILCEIVTKWKVNEIYIGCSGNFTIERVLKGCVNAKLHSNDVTVYSCLLGRYFSGQPLDVRIRSDYDGRMRFVEKYMDTDAGIIAVMLLLSKMSVYLSTKTNPYYEKMINAYVSQFDGIWKRTKEKIEKVTPFIESIYEGDVCEWVDKIPEDAGFICYPPFFSGDYEKMFKTIENIFEWTPPEYEMIDKDKIHEMFVKLTKRKYFMFGTNDYLPEFKEYLVGLAQTTNRGVPLYMYAKSHKSIIVTPRQFVECPTIQRIGVNEDIGQTIKIIKLRTEQFHALRSKYMNRYINPGSETASFGVIVDNKLIGVYAFSASPTLANWDAHIDTPTMYLLSDFPVAPSKYRKLAKLVLYAALSKESKDFAESLTNKRIYSLTTTAFAKKPTSMKYRGLFRLLNKKEIDSVSEDETDISKRYYGKGYMLNYGAAMGKWSLAEGFEEWKKKHGKDVKEVVL